MNSKEKYDVICVGAALIDMIAEVKRHPSEDDEVFVSNLTMRSGGAAANTAATCGRLGLKTAFLGKLGLEDEFGNKIKKDFIEMYVSTELIKYSEKFSTGSAYVALNNEGDRRIYAHSGAANYLSDTDIRESEISISKLIFLSSLKNIKPFIKAATIANRLGIPVILNPGMLIIEQGINKITSLLKTIDLLILSEREYKLLVEISNDAGIYEIFKSSKEIFDLGIKYLIITMGSEGAMVLDVSNYEKIDPERVKNVVDTTGAGDAFSAGFIYAYMHSGNFNFKTTVKNAKMGNYIASQVIQKLGARSEIPSKKEVQEYFQNIK
ncbi:MAG: hypothetical protein GF317_18440 [Candidatus Lokiarchaeota archaeon]|nr:hypothetical protein [Candidatus Lokiarchaeota archaeon]MBD3201495.1 hypothetical protein [Candidatus Lokiarchaeota archaeon]